MRTNQGRTKSIVVIFACMFYASLAGATPITIFATEDTYITENDGYGGVTSTHGDGAHVIVVRGKEGVNRTFPVIKFDLTSFAGKTITGSTADFVLNSKGGYHNTQSISIRESLVGWDEASASWANFGGSGFNEASQTGVNLITRNVTFTGVSEAILFTLPASVVQNWIDTPSSNNGLFLISNTIQTSTDQSFWSKEGGGGPSLAFDAIPEPGTMSLMGISSMGIFFVRKLRRRKKTGLSCLPIRIKYEDCPFKKDSEAPPLASTPHQPATNAVASRVSEGMYSFSVWKKQCSDQFIDRLFAFDRVRNSAKKTLRKKSISCFDAFLALIMK